MLLRKLLLTTVFLFFAILFLNAQPGTNDPSFNVSDTGFSVGDGFSGTVRVMTTQSDGKLIAGGWFHAYDGVNRYRIIRLNPDGTNDASFDPGYGASGTLNALAVQPDGKILIGGIHSYYHSRLSPGITRLNADGSFDQSFSSGLQDYANVNSILLQPDGKIIIAGYFSSYNGRPVGNIVRLHPDGSLDESFLAGSGANSAIFTTLLLPDGKLMVGGIFTTFNNTTANMLVRLNPDGSVDNTFNTWGSGFTGGYVYALAKLSNNRILVGGSFYSYNGIGKNGIACLLSNGALDVNYTTGSGITGAIRSISIQSDEKAIIGGSFTGYNGVPVNNVARLNTDGRMDTDFLSGSGTDDIVYSVLALPADKIMVGGDFLTYNGFTRHKMIRLNTNGALDKSFYNFSSSGAQGPVNAMLLQEDGKILIGGEFVIYNGKPKKYLARLNEDGTLDHTFNPSGTGPNDLIYTMVFQPDGKILIGGNFSKYNDVNRGFVARLHMDGSLDLTFGSGSGAGGSVMAIAVQQDGKILVGGSFPTFNNVTRTNIVRLLSNGSVDGSFNTISGANSMVYTIVPQPDQKILIGGEFTTYKSVSRNRIARLHADGTLDADFDPGVGADNGIRSIAVQNDGKILVAGGFQKFNGILRSGIIRLEADGRIDPSFDKGYGAGGTLKSVLIQEDGKILVAGIFSTYNFSMRNNIMRLHSNGSLDSSFNSGTFPIAVINAIRLTKGGKIMIGGSFTSYNNIGRNRVARLFGGAIQSGPVANTNLCQGSVFSLPFTAAGGYADSIELKVLLSNASGNFTTSSVIGTTKKPSSGIISCRIPLNAQVGSGYKIRVIVEEAGVTNAQDITGITINTAPVIPQITSSVPSLCERDSVLLASSFADNNQWFKNGTVIPGATLQNLMVTEPGSYSVRHIQNQCPVMSAASEFSIVPLPAKPEISLVGNILHSSSPTGNQWFFNGNAIAGSNAQQHRMQASGRYTVRVTVNGCSSLSNELHFVGTSLSNPETWNGEVTAYPNPVENKLFIKNTQARKLDVRLIDGTGKMVSQWLISATNNTLYVGNIPGGIYRLIIRDTKKNETISIHLVKL